MRKPIFYKNVGSSMVIKDGEWNGKLEILKITAIFNWLPKTYQISELNFISTHSQHAHEDVAI